MTTTTDVASRVLVALGDALRRRGGAQLEDLVDGLAEPIADSDRRIAPTDRGWAGAFDLDATPEPKWIGASIGSPLPGGLSVEEQREYIRDRAYWRRGTPEAIRGAVRSVLTGTRRVDLIERDGSPWRLRVRTYVRETAVSEAEIANAAATQKPVGIAVDVQVADGATYAHMLAEHPTFGAFMDAYPTYEDAVFHIPEEGTHY